MEGKLLRKTTNVFTMEVTIENVGAPEEIALLPSSTAERRALKEATAKIFAERLGADNVVVTRIQQFLHEEGEV